MSLDFDLTPAQLELRNRVRTFAATELTNDTLREIDASGRTPHELLPKMAALGFTGLAIPPEYGGAGGSAGDVTVLLEELGRASVEIASLLNRATGWGTETLLRFGTEAQKRRYLPGVVSGETIFAFSHTEPDAGSDAAAIRTRAVADGDDFVITGTKMFTTGAGECPVLMVSARTDPQATKHRGMSVFLLEGGTEGMDCHRIEKLGMRGAGGLYEVRYEGVRVPRSSLLGELNAGWKVITSTLERARVAQAAYCIGGAQQAIDDAVRFLQAPQASGYRLADSEATRHLLADLQTAAASARLLVYRAAWMIDERLACMREASIANLNATELLVRATSETMRVLGVAGVTREYPIERTLRDARLFIIGDGSSQVQRNLIARQMGL